MFARFTSSAGLSFFNYYAYLAFNRAYTHKAVASSKSPRSGQKFKEARQDAAVSAAHCSATADRSSQTGSSMPIEASPGPSS